MHLYLLPIREQPLEWKPQSYQLRKHRASPLAATVQESEGKTPDRTQTAQHPGEAGISPVCGASTPWQGRKEKAEFGVLFLPS